MLNSLMHFLQAKCREYSLLSFGLAYAAFDLGYPDLCHFQYFFLTVKYFLQRHAPLVSHGIGIAQLHKGGDGGLDEVMGV